jgi:hypothetical protein
MLTTEITHGSYPVEFFWLGYAFASLPVSSPDGNGSGYVCAKDLI